MSYVLLITLGLIAIALFGLFQTINQHLAHKQLERDRRQHYMHRLVQLQRGKRVNRRDGHQSGPAVEDVGRVRLAPARFRSDTVKRPGAGEGLPGRRLPSFDAG